MLSHSRPSFLLPVLAVAHTSALQLQNLGSAPIPPAAGFFSPADQAGSMLTQLNVTFPPGQGEPLNIIISGNSDSRVLVDTTAGGGLMDYFQSFGFSAECLGTKSAALEEANLGDGNGYQNETAVIRWDYGNPDFGTCTETVNGGNHFRYWTQNGPKGNSGAIFLAVSYELPIAQNHDIVPNGYNNGRDWLVGNITGTQIPTASLKDGMNFTGTTTSINNVTYSSTVTYSTGLLPNTNIGINHNITVGTDGRNSSDGFLAVIDVKIVSAPASVSAASTWRVRYPPLALFFVLLPLFSF